MDKKIGLPHFVLGFCVILIILLLCFVYALNTNQTERATQATPLVEQIGTGHDNTTQLNEILSSIESLAARQSEFQSWVEQKFAESSQRDDVVDTQDESFDEPVPERMTTEDRKFLFETAMQNQAINTADDGWTEETVIEVQTLFSEAPEFASANLLSTQCGTELCQIEIVYKSDASYDDKELFENHFLLKLGSRLPRASSFTEKTPDGGTKQIFYMAKAGTRLPTEAPISTQVRPANSNSNSN